MKKICLIVSLALATLFINSCKKNKQPNTPPPTPDRPAINLEGLLVNTPAVDRRFFGAKYEQQSGILHGAGQDFDGFNDYSNTLGKSQYPIIYMDYIGLTNSKATIDNWGVKLKNDLNRLPSDVIPQIGLSMTGGNDSR